MKGKKLCPSIEDLDNFWDKEKPSDVRELLLDHISTCGECRSMWNRMNTSDLEADAAEIDTVTALMFEDRNRRILEKQIAQNRKQNSTVVLVLVAIILVAASAIILQLLKQ